jgi:hypothetical protein
MCDCPLQTSSIEQCMALLTEGGCYRLAEPYRPGQPIDSYTSLRDRAFSIRRSGISQISATAT